MAKEPMADKRMKRVMFFTNLPSPYRVEFFSLLGKYCDLHVVFELGKARGRDDTWIRKNYPGFTAHFLKSHAYSNEGSFSFEIVKKYKEIHPEVAIVCDISSLSGIRFLDYLIRHKRSYWIEGDGAFDEASSWLKTKIKKRFFSRAERLLFTSKEHRRYLLRFGADPSRLFWYPFSSIHESQIASWGKMEASKKKKADEKFTFLSVGRFLDLKNFETALSAFGKAHVPNSEFLLIGGDPLPSYLDLIQKENIPNVRFLPFLQMEDLFEQMRQADAFVFPSLHDVWGLVINEAAANGLPIVSSRGALAAVEMSQYSEGITLFDGLDVEDLAFKMKELAQKSKEERDALSQANLSMIQRYTIETMAKRHVELLELGPWREEQ